MKVALLSGAYKNAGDYLIIQRCRELIEHVFPTCTITEYERRKSLDNKIDELNKNDVLVLGGGSCLCNEHVSESNTSCFGFE